MLSREDKGSKGTRETRLRRDKVRARRAGAAAREGAFKGRAGAARRTACASMPRAHGRDGRKGLEQLLDHSHDKPVRTGSGPALRRPSLPTRPPPEAPLPLQRQMAIDRCDAPPGGPCPRTRVLTLQHAEHQDSTLYR